MFKPNPHPWIDAQLRSVPVPEDLPQHLRAVTLGDADLDDQLRGVPLPSRLTGRLRFAVAGDDDGIDALLREVHVPYRVVQKLRAAPGYRLRFQRIAGWVAAASLAVAIGLSYFGAAMGLLIAGLPAPPQPAPELAWYVAGELMPDLSDATLDVMQLEVLSEGGGEGEEWAAWPPVEVPEPPLLARRSPPPSPYRFDEFTLFSRQQGVVDPFLDSTPARWGVFGAHEPFDEPGGWQEAQSIRPRGIPAPTVAGFNSSILVRFGVFPFVPTAADESLHSVSVPLNVSTESFDSTRHSVTEGRLPAPERVRTEEFLAALDYPFPQPSANGVRVSLFGGPSPFVPGAFVLQGGVQAAEVAVVPRPPVHLVLVVDVSSGNRRRHRLSIVRRALADLCRQLGTEDRISLVAYDRHAEVIAERAGRDHAEQLQNALRGFSGRGATNPGAGLTAAYVLAHDAGEFLPATQPLVVLLSDELGNLPIGAAARIERRLSEAAAEGIRLHVVASGPAPDPLNVQLQSLAAAGSGRVWVAEDARRLGWVLREIVSGQPQVVAEDVRLTLRFDPRSVPFYRLLGHEPGAKTLESGCVLYSGQSGTALFDVRLRQGLTAGDVLATAELTWREPGSDRRERETAVIRLGDLPATLVESPLPLQAAMVAAETGELLRRSVYTQLRPRPGSLAGVVELLDQLDTELWQNPSFCDFAEVVQGAIKARPHRGGTVK